MSPWVFGNDCCGCMIAGSVQEVFKVIFYAILIVCTLMSTFYTIILISEMATTKDFIDLMQNNTEIAHDIGYNPLATAMSMCVYVFVLLWGVFYACLFGCPSSVNVKW